ncbi:N-acetylmuramoyl-L-alanine amidase [Streptomyces spirodelae]|uniref:N-acetylmuramoyl-L-alanine amidase n=1 Tax=Streptomyces spirodelae TaxID=2812904 RepID=A0ABS3X1Z3_9ACTN|nr:peptidoglycan recognition protein [Streptomyces spirodelae]MBO8189392.1 N-acetylmuramoyl-L-alanine amidase [Streptomyces spirodelae]
MRANLAQSIGVASAAALLLPLAPLVPAAALSPSPAAPSSRSAPSSPSAVAGHTQSLSFDESPKSSAGPRAPGEADSAVRVVSARTVRPYSLLGVVWDRADQPLRGRVEVRARDADTGRWSEWQQLEAHPSGAGPAGEGGRARGATAPLWVGPSDGVEARVLPESAASSVSLPDGLRLELVDPGPDEQSGPVQTPGEPKTAEPDRGPGPDKAPDPDKAPGTDTGAAAGSAPDTGTEPATGGEPQAGGDPQTGGDSQAGSDPQSGSTPQTGSETGTGDGAMSGQAGTGAVLPELTKEATEAEYQTGGSSVGPRPRIVTRRGWGANEKLREPGHAYTKTVKAAFVHHTAMSNTYKCSKAPSIIRAMYRYHVKSSKWRDIGYNFLIDKCGTIYEGRSGGVAKAVRGAHTYGFNTNTTGIAVLGSFNKTKPPQRAVDAIARLTAWKLGLSGVDPAGKTWLKSGGGKFKKGRKIRFHTVSGHKDGYVTECPGARLYGKLGEIRTAAAHLQGR